MILKVLAAAGLISLLAFGSVAIAQDVPADKQPPQPKPLVAQPLPAQPQRQDDEILIRTYNVSDLLWMANDYPLDSAVQPPSQASANRSSLRGGGGGQSMLFAGDGVVVGRKSAGPIELDPLSKLIVETVAAETWRENGGTIGSIRSISSVLVIMQTRQNHETIQQLLDELRRSAGSAQVVTVRATWLAVAQGGVPKLMTEVKDDWLAQQKIYAESQLICFSGQTVHISSGRGKQVATDQTPIVGDSAVAFDPDMASVLSGVTLQISPQLIPGSESAILDVQSTASEWTGEKEPPLTTGGAAATAPSGSAQASGQVDRVNMLCQEMKTTSRLPLGKKVLVGGMTLDASNAEQDGRQLYLVMEVDASK